MASVHMPLDFEFLATDSGRLIPGQFRAACRPVGKQHPRESLALPPTATSVHLDEPSIFTDAATGGKRFDVGDVADNGEAHDGSPQTRPRQSTDPGYGDQRL